MLPVTSAGYLSYTGCLAAHFQGVRVGEVLPNLLTVLETVLLILLSLCTRNIAQREHTRIWTTDWKLKYLLKIALTLNSFIGLDKIIVLK